ncbi:MAG: BamA/TamA family outer membrane protein [Lentimicrobiaceae bacterium]|nr:BamA/TamA family outer membrane protein [Lentimicrobiaceae bacterium]
MYKTLIFLLFFFTTLFANGQYCLRVEYKEISAEAQSLAERQKIKSSYKSVQKMERHLELLVQKLQRNGYISASLDTLIIVDNQCVAEIFVGEKMQFRRIAVEGIPQEEMLAFKIDKRFQRQSSFSMEDVFLYNKNLSNHLWNAGYPFATAQLIDIEEDTARKTAKILVQKNNFITFDSIIVVGNLKISKGFCYGYLGLKRKKPYNESLVKDIPSRLQELPFAALLRSPSVSFGEDKAILFIYADKQKNNQFDGYLGVVPNDETSGKLLLTGSLTLDLNNVFTCGENVKLDWKRIQVLSQNLHISADFPYLFASPFGIDGVFQLEKKDTNYLNLNALAGIRYYFKKSNYLRAYYQFKNSRLTPNAALAYLSSLPSNIDYDAHLYGLELNFRKLDYLFNPRKGYAFRLNSAVGQRFIIKNTEIADSLYQNIQFSSVQLQLTGNVDIYFPIKKRWVWYAGLKGGYLYGRQLFENELFKIGGLKTLRGFDEQSIFASSYLILSNELRYILGKRSYFQLFFDIATLEKHTSAEYVFDAPFGFGVGISFDTKAGIFAFNYALGREMNNPPRIASGKITFGYTALF